MDQINMYDQDTRQKECPEWKTQDGRLIPVCEMTTQHIKNSLNMLKLNGYIGLRTLNFYLYGPRPIGNGAQDAFDSEFNSICDSPISTFIDTFEDELKKREGI